jgi:hypothetical protein
MAWDPWGHKDRFLALWEQVAGHYRDYPPELLFELLNEPNDQLNASLWNRYVFEALELVRETNPTREVVIGPAQWNAYDWVSTFAVRVYASRRRVGGRGSAELAGHDLGGDGGTKSGYYQQLCFGRRLGAAQEGSHPAGGVWRILPSGHGFPRPLDRVRAGRGGTTRVRLGVLGVWFRLRRL